MKKICTVLYLVMMLFCQDVFSDTKTGVEWLYASQQFSNMNIVDMELNSEATIIRFELNSTDSIVLYPDAFIVEDDGKRHRLINDTGNVKPLVYKNEGDGQKLFQLKFEACDDINTKSIDLFSGVNRIYGLHKPGVSPLEEQGVSDEMPTPEWAGTAFEPSEIEIIGKIMDDDMKGGKEVYCQYNTFHLAHERENRLAPIGEDGTFDMKFRLTHPAFLTFYYYGENEFFITGKRCHYGVYVYPNEKTKVTFHINRTQEVEVEKMNGEPEYHNYTIYPVYPLMSRCLSMMGEKTVKDAYLDILKETYEQNMSLARYIVRRYNFSPTEANLYYNELLFELVMGTAYVRERMIAEGKQEPTAILSCYSVLNPYDENYLANPNFVDAYSANIAVFDSIRNKVYKDHEDMPIAEKELLILHEQNELLNKCTGWSGLTYIMQAIYVSNMFKMRGCNRNKRIDDCVIDRIAEELTHPIFKNGARDVFINEIQKE